MTEDVKNRLTTNWTHKEQCTETECYCADDERPDPICDCGRPAWSCICQWLDEDMEGLE